jgi:predicted Rossmann-fold nucleotide-binding protein
MAAVSQGAREGGGRTVGVTVELLTQSRSPNPWIDQEIRTAALLQRVDKLIELGDGYAVLPGGAGTLLELGAVWNLALLGALQDKPIVVVGPGWQKVLQTMIANLHTLEYDLRFLTLAPTAEAAADVLAERLRP